MDFALVTALIFFLWLAAKKTKKLLKRLQPEDQPQLQRKMIVIKAGFGGGTSHLAEPADAPAAVPEPVAVAVAELPGQDFKPVFEVEKPEMSPAASEPWKEFTWEPSGETVASAS